MLRAYRAGDAPKLIAWKALAREQGLLTKEFSAMASSELWLDWDEARAPDVEARLSILCHWVIQAESFGQSYGLRLPGVSGALAADTTGMTSSTRRWSTTTEAARRPLRRRRSRSRYASGTLPGRVGTPRGAGVQRRFSVRSATRPRSTCCRSCSSTSRCRRRRSPPRWVGRTCTQANCRSPMCSSLPAPRQASIRRRCSIASIAIATSATAPAGHGSRPSRCRPRRSASGRGASPPAGRARRPRRRGAKSRVGGRMRPRSFVDAVADPGG